MKKIEEIVADCEALPLEDRVRLYQKLTAHQAFWMGRLLEHTRIGLVGGVGAVLGGALVVATMRYCEVHGFQENPVVAYWCSPVVVVETMASRLGLASHFIVGSALYGAYAALVIIFRQPRWLMVLALLSVVALNTLLFLLAHPLVTWN